MISYLYYVFAFTDEFFPSIISMFLVIIFSHLDESLHHLLSSYFGSAELFQLFLVCDAFNLSIKYLKENLAR